MKNFTDLLTEVATPFATDKFFDLPQQLASWVERYGKKKVEVAETGTHWQLRIKGSLNGADVFALARMDHIIAISKNKLLIEVRK